MELLNPINAFEALQTLLQDGGTVLTWIMIAAFFLFALIVERLAYYITGHDKLVSRLVSEWKNRDDHTSWRAHAIRDELISRVKANTGANVAMIKTLVAIAPLLGLLGTVTGMIEVFDVMGLSGSSNAREMSRGIFKATIPTMAGMSVALVGLFCSNYVERRSRRETRVFAEALTFE